mgnify:CR=1 FL=1
MPARPLVVAVGEFERACVGEVGHEAAEDVSGHDVRQVVAAGHDHGLDGGGGGGCGVADDAAYLVGAVGLAEDELAVVEAADKGCGVAGGHEAAEVVARGGGGGGLDCAVVGAVGEGAAHVGDVVRDACELAVGAGDGGAVDYLVGPGSVVEVSEAGVSGALGGGEVDEVLAVLEPSVDFGRYCSCVGDCGADLSLCAEVAEQAGAVDGAYGCLVAVDGGVGDVLHGVAVAVECAFEEHCADEEGRELLVGEVDVVGELDEPACEAVLGCGDVCGECEPLVGVGDAVRVGLGAAALQRRGRPHDAAGQQHGCQQRQQNA